MKLPLYIALRYLFAKKSRNAINIISAISVAGVGVGTMALIIVLSVFNGMENMVRSIFSTFDPDLEVKINEGKVFSLSKDQISGLDSIEGIAHWTKILEENALLRYDEKQSVATIKGVEDNYIHITNLDSDSIMWDGDFILKGDNGRMYAVVGMGVAQNLGLGLNFLSSINIYLPERTAKVRSIDLSSAFKREYIFPSGIFSVEQDFDSRYIFVPIDLMRNLLEYDTEISAVEIKFRSDGEGVQDRVAELFGPDFVVKNKYQQQEVFYKVMRSERLAIFLILSFILVIACFNVIGSLTMLILEKEKDIEILRSMGASKPLIKRIFIIEGWMISIFGAIGGLVIGGIVCWLQMEFGLVKLAGESLIIDSYPVVMKVTDFILVAGTVLLIGFVAAWYPVRFLSLRYLNKNEKQ